MPRFSTPPTPTSTSTPTRTVRLCSRLTALGLVIAAAASASAQSAATKTAILQAERSARDSGSSLADYALDVFVNSRRVGALKPSERADFTFEPRADGINEMTFKMGARLTEPSSAEKFLSGLTRVMTPTTPTSGLMTSLTEALIDQMQTRHRFIAAAGQRVTMKVTDSAKGIVPVVQAATTPSTPRPSAPAKASVKSIRFDPELKRVVKRSLPVGVLRNGASKTYTARQIVTHSVTTTDGWKLGAEVRAGASAEMDAIVASARATIEVAIRGEIERSTSTTYAASEEHERSVTLTGDGKTRYRVVWAYYYKTGKAQAVVDGKPIEMPFEFEDNFDIEEEVVK